MIPNELILQLYQLKMCIYKLYIYPSEKNIVRGHVRSHVRLSKNEFKKKTNNDIVIVTTTISLLGGTTTFPIVKTICLNKLYCLKKL